MQIPNALLNSLKDVRGFNQEAFQRIHESGEQIVSIRTNVFKPNSKLPIPNSERVPWCDTGYYLPSRPSFTFDPHFHAGCYYVQEASSMFLEQALKQTIDLSKPLKVLDLCAAPGGKSTHIQSLITEASLLVSNEVIRSRSNVLKDNIIKWGSSNVVVTNNDPADFDRLENYFDVIVVDAPCSGSGLFRRDPEAIEEWSENNVQLCSQRQQRILSDVWPALKKDGIMIYSTCSYSEEEDENIVNWLMKEFPSHYSPLTIQADWGIVDTGKGYRFWPDKLKGEGFFIACFRKTSGEDFIIGKNKDKRSTLNNKEKELVFPWLNNKEYHLLKNENTVYAWPIQLKDDFSMLLNNTRVIYSGVELGELVRDKMIPSHALALSGLISDQITSIELDLEEAIRYLQRKDLSITPPTKGWQLVKFQGYSLGWINALPGRINNYYPKELRILKDG